MMMLWWNLFQISSLWYKGVYHYFTSGLHHRCSFAIFSMYVRAFLFFGFSVGSSQILPGRLVVCATYVQACVLGIRLPKGIVLPAKYLQNSFYASVGKHLKIAILICLVICVECWDRTQCSVCVLGVIYMVSSVSACSSPAVEDAS